MQQKKPIAKFRNNAILLTMSSLRRTYKIRPITVNNVKVVQVVIDSHFEKKHSKTMNDQLILALVN